jgi:hypothetical protein
MAFHLQADGQVERMIQNVVQTLCAMVRPDQQDWATKLSMAEFTINASTNASTGYAPFELIYSFMLKMTMEIPPSDYPGVVDFTNKVKENLKKAHATIIHNCVQQTIQVNKKRCPDLPLKRVN